MSYIYLYYTLFCKNIQDRIIIFFRTATESRIKMKKQTSMMIVMDIAATS